MPEAARADTGTPTGPTTLTLKEGVASLLQGDADQRKADTRGRRQEPEPAANDNEAGAQDPEEGAVDTGDEPTDDADQEVEPADDDQPEDRVEEEPAAYTVKVDGKEHKVTLTELLKGYSRQADYTRRTTALAKQADEAREAVTRAAAEREQYRQALEIIHKGLTENQAEPDWATLERTDPIEYLRQKELFRERRDRAAQVRAEHDRVLQQQQVETAENFRTYVETQRTALVEKIPLWKDPAKAAAERAALREYATEVLGYSQDEIKQAFDHRLIVMLRKAWLYDRIAAKQGLADKRVRTAPTEIPSRARLSQAGTSRSATAARVQQMRRLEKSGDIRDAVGLLMMEQPKNA